MANYKNVMTPERQAKLIAAAKAYYAKRPLEVRFWEKVDKRGPDECWPWKGSMHGDGYGQIWMDGKVRRAHRASLRIHGMEPPAYESGSSRTLVVDHVCGNRGCVNPRHLRVVDVRTNAVENNRGVWARNAAKTHCPHGHPYSPENTALVKTKRRINRHGNYKPQNHPGRMCLTCYPDKWRYAIIPRGPPPRGASAAAARMRRS